MKISSGSHWRRRVFCVSAFVVGATVLAMPAQRAMGGTMLNLRSDDRTFAKISLNGEKTTSVYRVESACTTSYYVNEGCARDAVIAYALRDEIATMRVEDILDVSEVVVVGDNGRAELMSL